MRTSGSMAGILILAACAGSAALKAEHAWLPGKVLDRNQSRQFAGLLGDPSGNAVRSSSAGSTNIVINGNAFTARDGVSSQAPVTLYRVYDHLVIDGDDAIYVTSERMHTRWSKGMNVAVNGSVKYYVDGQKLHLLNEANQEHTVEIAKIIRKVSPGTESAPSSQPSGQPAKQPNGQPASGTPDPRSPAAQVPITVESVPPGADIEVDGHFVGISPATLSFTTGTHAITIKKTGMTVWTRLVNVTGGSFTVIAELKRRPEN